jgi:hypothetical protein
MAHKLNKLVDAFLLYAEHLTTCKSWTHRHKQTVDRRARCTRTECTCGLLELLTLLRPDVEYVTPCTDVERGTLFGLPMVESDTVPQGDVWVGRSEGVVVRLVFPKQTETGIDTESQT